MKKVGIKEINFPRVSAIKEYRLNEKSKSKKLKKIFLIHLTENVCCSSASRSPLQVILIAPTESLVLIHISDHTQSNLKSEKAMIRLIFTISYFTLPIK